MSEAPEQFRDRIGRLLADYDGVRWDHPDLTHDEREGYRVSATVIYEQALRDVVAFARAQMGEHPHVRVVVAMVRFFATQRGIALTERRGAS